MTDLGSNRADVEVRFRKCDGSDKHHLIINWILAHFGVAFSLAGALSLTKLIRDAYTIEFNNLVQNLIAAYERALLVFLEPIEGLAYEILRMLDISYSIPDNWKHLFAFMVLYLSGMRYTPRRYCFAVWIFRAWAVIVGLLFSITSVFVFQGIDALYKTFFSTLFLMLGIYFYYLPLHIWRATFDRPIEMEFYNGNDDWWFYFSKQEKDFINILVNFFFAFSFMVLFSFVFEVNYSVAILLAFFITIVAIRAMAKGFYQALEWRNQPANSGLPFRNIFLAAANTKTSIHYMAAILGMLCLIAFGTYGQ